MIAIDLPGFGASPALPPEVTPTPSALADAVARLLGELEIVRPHMVGNSLGGWIALELARSSRARSVTALCPAGLWGAPVLRAGAPARGRLHRIARRLRPLLPLIMLSKRARRLALGHVVADPDRVPTAAARRMVSSYARAGAYDATNTAMLATAGCAHSDAARCGPIPMWDDPDLVAELVLETCGLWEELAEVLAR